MLKKNQIRLVFNYVPFSGVEIKKFRSLLNERYGCDLFLVSKKMVNNTEKANVLLYQVWAVSLEINSLRHFIKCSKQFNSTLKEKGLIPLCVWDAEGYYSYVNFNKLLPKMNSGFLIPVILLRFALSLWSVSLSGLKFGLGLFNFLRYKNGFKY